MFTESPALDAGNPPKTPQPAKRRAKPIGQFCADWSMSRTKAYELMNAGKLRAVLNGGRRVVLLEDEEAYAASLKP
jgi:hypothetical protein